MRGIELEIFACGFVSILQKGVRLAFMILESSMGSKMMGIT